MNVMRYLGLSCLLMLANSLWGQQGIIHQKSIEKKSKYNTVLTLTNGNKVTGKLTGCSDSVITISSSKKYAYGIFYIDSSYYYNEIQKIKIARKISARGFLIGTGAGLGYGCFISLSMVLLSFGMYQPNALPIILSTTLAGAAIGITIESLARTKYKFPIEGSYNKFAGYRHDISLMVIDKASFMTP